MITMLRKCAIVIHILMWSVCYGKPKGVSRREDCVCVVRGGPVHQHADACTRALRGDDCMASGARGEGEGEIVGACESSGAHMVSTCTLVYVSVLTGRIPFARGLGVEGGRGERVCATSCDVYVMPPQCCIDQDVQIKTMTVLVHMRAHNSYARNYKPRNLAPSSHTHLVPALSPPSPTTSFPEQPLTQSEFYAASWEVVNSPSTSVTKWGPIEDWDTSGVTTLKYAFTTWRNEAGEHNGYTGNSKAASFNSDISKWITSSVKSLYFTFDGAAAFKSDISKWITSSVTDMSFTFYEATALTSCNKRKIADAWKSNAVFAATNYNTDWAADTCSVC